MDHGAKLLEQIPKPEHPENHFVFGVLEMDLRRR
jgi:hypothetical protein